VSTRRRTALGGWIESCDAGEGDSNLDPMGHRTEVSLPVRLARRLSPDAYAITTQYPGFIAFLRATGIESVVICGLATNICCYHTARDLRQQGFDVFLVEDACAGLDIPTGEPSQAQAKAEGQRLGVRYLTTNEIGQFEPDEYLLARGADEHRPH
jgi:isochorismatase family protein